MNFQSARKKVALIRQKAQKGFTLVELMVVLGIIGLALYAVIGSAFGGSNASKVQIEVKNLQTISNSIKTGFGTGGSSYTGLTETLVKNAGGFPTQMTDGGTIQNTWGGAVTAGPTTLGGTGYDIVYNAVPQEACVNLVAQVKKGYVRIKVNATNNAIASWTSTAIDTACVAGPSNVVTFNGV